MEKIFTQADQERFAKLSHDYNPIHVNPTLARRLIYGRPVVHGLHGVLWALSVWVNSRTAPFHLLSLDVTFLKPVFLLTPVTLDISNEGSHFELRLSQDNQVATRIKLQSGLIDGSKEIDEPVDVTVRSGPQQPVKLEPVTLDEAAMVDLEGELEIYIDRELAREMGFANLMKVLGVAVVAELLSLTRLVGMYVPGFHSVFSGFKAKSLTPQESKILKYRVTDLDNRFHQLEIEARGAHLETRIKVFVRPKPAEQPAFSDLRTIIRPDEFLEQRALVIGGSRGLGEVATKALAAGGANVLFTYSKGVAEASLIEDQIAKGGGHTTSFAFVALNLTAEAEDLFKNFQPTHVYYFATPFISSGQKGQYSRTRLEQFLDFYVDGFFRLFESTRITGTSRYFYPSTIYLDDLPLIMADYVLAKGCGETLCSWIEKNYPGIRIFHPRLPRMATDQTASMLESENATTLQIVDFIREFRSW